MAIHYYCHHCGTMIGSLNEMSIHSEAIGLHKLTHEERQEMISYAGNGDIHIKSICEDCQEALERTPDFHQNDYLIH